MELFSNINWLALIIGWILSYGLGALWFSPLMFLKKWNEGLGTPPVKDRSFALLMVVQAATSFIFALALALALPYSLLLAVIIAIAASGMIKSFGLFDGKTTYAVATETAYILVQAAIIIIVLLLFS